MSLNNVILAVFFPQLHWLILAFSLIVVTEFFIFDLFLKNRKQSFLIIFIGNVVSTLAALPIIFIGFQPIWIYPLTVADIFREEWIYGQLDTQWLGDVLILFTLSFIAAFVLSVFIEGLIGKAFKLNFKQMFKPFIYSNLVSYLELLLLFFLGIFSWVILLQPNLETSSYQELFDGWFYQRIEAPTSNPFESFLFSFASFGVSVLFLLSFPLILLLIAFLIWEIIEYRQKKNTRIGF